MTRFDFCYVSYVVFTCFKPAAGQLLACPLQLPSPEKSWMRSRAGSFLFSITFSLVRPVILGRGVWFTPLHGIRRGPKLYIKLSIWREAVLYCTDKTGNGRPCRGGLLRKVQTELQNLCKLDMHLLNANCTLKKGTSASIGSRVLSSFLYIYIFIDSRKA